MLSVRGVANDRQMAEVALRTLHEHTSGEGSDEIAGLIHEDAEMRLLVSHGGLLKGRDAILEALASGWEAETFVALVENFEWLDETTSLTSAYARYAREGGGLVDGRVYWLDEMRDGKIWRVAVFRSEAEARHDYERRAR